MLNITNIRTEVDEVLRVSGRVIPKRKSIYNLVSETTLIHKPPYVMYFNNYKLVCDTFKIIDKVEILGIYFNKIYYKLAK